MTGRMEGFIAWQGPSPVDGRPIVLVITGPSLNTKTGPMCQAWLLVRDVGPFEALSTGHDRSICGDCVHRSGERRTCYVSMFHGPRQIWARLEAGGYPVLSVAEASARLADQQLRATAYGDPAFVPFEVWDELLAEVSGWAGYTHQWRTCDPQFRSMLMASVETVDELAEAQAAGWRTFRARAASDPLLPGEFQCPASDEAGHRTTCARCQLCRGTSSPAKSVSILLHGKGAAARRGGPRTRWDSLRAQIRVGGSGLLRLTPTGRLQAVLALRQWYRRRGEDVDIRSRHVGDGVYRFQVRDPREVES